MLQPQRKRYVKWESFHFKIKHVLLSVCLKYHIYEYFIDKRVKGDINIISGVKNQICCLIGNM